MAGLTEQTFARLLDVLDADRALAGERYEDLRRTLVRFFEWRGAPFPEDHADQTLDRVARRLAEGVEIKNIGGYAYVVARLDLPGDTKGPESRRVEIEPAGLTATAGEVDVAEDSEPRLGAWIDCLHGLPADSRELIVEYYRETSADGSRRAGPWPSAWGSRARRSPTARSACATSSNGVSTPVSGTGPRHDSLASATLSESDLR